MNPRAARTGLKAALASAVAVALLSTGAAFAASGHAPWSHAPASATAATSDHTTPTHPTPPAESEPTDDPSESAGDGPDAQAMWGLCRAYLAGAKADHGQALSSPAFVALVLVAGGADQVADFCTTLPRPGSDRVHPTRPAMPSQAVSPTRPTQAAPPSHPASPSHSAPASPPSSHPNPTSHPDSSSHPTAPQSLPSARSHP